MTLRKDDPIYYKKKIENLMQQAYKEGLRVKTESVRDGIRINFKSDNGDTTSVYIEND